MVDICARGVDRGEPLECFQGGAVEEEGGLARGGAGGRPEEGVVVECGGGWCREGNDCSVRFRVVRAAAR